MATLAEILAKKNAAPASTLPESASEATPAAVDVVVTTLTEPSTPLSPVEQLAENVMLEIRARIKSLEGYIGPELRAEMDSLRTALLENPAACALLMPEDIGALADAHRRKLGIAVAQAAASKKPAAGKSSIAKMSNQQILDNLADL